jgi:CRP-like cAMP-binding protein
MPNVRAHVRGTNRLLQLLPERDRKRVLSNTQHCVQHHRDEVFQRYSPIKNVHFPLDGVISLVIEMRDGASAEVGVVGNEGMAGLPLLTGSSAGPVEAFYQIPGQSLCMSAQAFKKEIARRGWFEQILQRYSQIFFNQVAQSTACNRLHTVQARLCRWLLMCQDRVGAPEINLTQEFLAQMLGVRRTSVNAAAGALQKLGLIRYRRGLIQILDRPAIEAKSCECYAVVRADYARMN